jgi:CheY-like chemotaxis protein/ketosteroid isomerase-like protein
MLTEHMARIFVCDDDGAYRALLRVVLTQSGEHEVVGEARDGRECIERAPQVCPDVILLDLNMPRMSGIEALPVLRDLLPDAKIIALTTAAANDREAEFVDLGGLGYIEKPHDALALTDALQRVLEAASEPRLDLVAEMFRRWSMGEHTRALELFADDAEVHPLASDETYVGPDQIRELWASVDDEYKQASITADRLLLAGDDQVMLLATASLPRRTPDGDTYTERFAVAWVFTVRGGRIRAVRGFSSWEEARDAAGLSHGEQPRLERKLARSAWRWLTSRLPSNWSQAGGGAPDAISG